jgi:type I restriction enzyme R subunit
MEHRTSGEDEQKIRAASGGLGLRDLSARLVEALDPDRQEAQAKADLGIPPDSDQPVPESAIQAAADRMTREAVKPLYDPRLREVLVEVKRKNEITIDHVSQDVVLEAGFSTEALDRARTIVKSFEAFIEEHKDEITALQVLYSKPYRQRLKFEDVKDLAERIQAPPYLWTESQLWQAYAALEKDKVKGASGKRILTDLVSLVRFAMHQEPELIPFPETVQGRFATWLAQQETRGARFTDEQRRWLEMIRDHIAANLAIENDDFEYAPFAREGGLGKVYQLFGDQLPTVLSALNVELAE